MSGNKYAARRHSWNHERSCVYLVGDPKRKPIISGMMPEAASDMAALLDFARLSNDDESIAVRLRGFESEHYGRNTFESSFDCVNCGDAVKYGETLELKPEGIVHEDCVHGGEDDQ